MSEVAYPYPNCEEIGNLSIFDPVLGALKVAPLPQD